MKHKVCDVRLRLTAAACLFVAALSYVDAAATSSACLVRRSATGGVDSTGLNQLGLDFSGQGEERFIYLVVALRTGLNVADAELVCESLGFLTRDCSLLGPIRLVSDQQAGDAF